MSAPQYKTVNFTLNGVETHKMIDVRSSLMDMLRDNYSLHSVKEGCAVGECGACTVLIDGEVFNACIYLAVWVEGKEVITTEGLTGPNGELSEVQQAFVDEFAVQCGFCTPGFVVAAEALIRSGKTYTRDQLRKNLAGNLCRCTGYENIINAVETALERHHAAKVNAKVE
ncbi:MAG TPA: (2Fe-2S)-binding protein [Fastidiosipila sp.]|nr:(2Fe-2S)-binding protein [Fastidiosipila sp.]